MSDKKAVTKKAVAKTGKAKAKRTKKQMKPPFKIMFGRVQASGKGYDFERHACKAADEVMALAQTAIDKNDDRLREIVIIINPEAIA
jgi:2-methylcitrate dehydratase PrpD